MLCSRALAAAVARSCGHALGRDRLHLEAADLLGEPPARVRDLRELLGVRRPAGNLARLGIERGKLVCELHDPLDALRAARLQAL